MFWQTPKAGVAIDCSKSGFVVIDQTVTLELRMELRRLIILFRQALIVGLFQQSKPRTAAVIYISSNLMAKNLAIQKEAFPPE